MLLLAEQRYTLHLALALPILIHIADMNVDIPVRIQKAVFEDAKLKFCNFTEFNLELK